MFKDNSVPRVTFDRVPVPNGGCRRGAQNIHPLTGWDDEHQHVTRGTTLLKSVWGGCVIFVRAHVLTNHRNLWGGEILAAVCSF